MSGAAKDELLVRPACLGPPDESEEGIRRRSAMVIAVARSFDTNGLTADDRLCVLSFLLARELHHLPAAERAALERWFGGLTAVAARGIAGAEHAQRLLATLPPAGSA